MGAPGKWSLEVTAACRHGASRVAGGKHLEEGRIDRGGNSHDGWMRSGKRWFNILLQTALSTRHRAEGQTCVFLVALSLLSLLSLFGSVFGGNALALCLLELLALHLDGVAARKWGQKSEKLERGQGRGAA